MAYKTGKRTRILSDDMKLLVVQRYNGKSLYEHFPKVKAEKICIKCVDCQVEFGSNNYDFLDKFPNNRCISCVQVVKWQKDHERLSVIRQTDEYRQKMSESIKSSDAYRSSIKERGKKHVKYWDKVRGFTKEELYDEWTLYRKVVYNISEKICRIYKSDINPDNLLRKEYHLDHKYSVLEGFRNNIPPYIISGKDNLELIPYKDNLSKGCECSITKGELMNSFFTKEVARIADTCYGN